MNLEEKIRNYCEKILSGEAPSCKFHRWAVERFCRDLERAKSAAFPYRMDWSKAERFIRFCGMCRHYKGEKGKSKANPRGEIFRPSMFQAFCGVNIFGWVHKETGYRRFQMAYLKWPRKSGKTFFAAVCGDYMYLADNEAAPDVLCAATKKEQAGEAFKSMQQIIRNSDELRKLCTVQTHLIKEPGGGEVKSIASDAQSLDGSNPHCAILDEIHAYKDGKLVDVIMSGTGARTQPLLLLITSGGRIADGYDAQMMEAAAGCLNPGLEMEEDIYDRDFYFVLQSDDTDKWDDPEHFKKVNPNIGKSVQVGYYEGMLKRVKSGVMSEAEFLTKYLNQTLRGGAAWFELIIWDKLRKEIDYSALPGRPLMTCDFSKRRDLTSCCFSWYDLESLWLKPYFFAPEDQPVDEGENNKKYRSWAKGGHIILTPGETIDFEVVHDQMLGECRKYGCDVFGYDQRFGDDIAKQWERDGMQGFVLPNQARFLVNSFECFDTMYRTERIVHDGHPILRWNISNVRKKYLNNSELLYLPMKQGRLQKIDGAVVSMLALYMWQTGEFDHMMDGNYGGITII